jgi:hypothetical protein
MPEVVASTPRRRMARPRNLSRRAPQSGKTPRCCDAFRIPESGLPAPQLPQRSPRSEAGRRRARSSATRQCSRGRVIVTASRGSCRRTAPPCSAVEDHGLRAAGRPRPASPTRCRAASAYQARRENRRSLLPSQARAKAVPVRHSPLLIDAATAGRLPIFSRCLPRRSSRMIKCERTRACRAEARS